MRHSTNGMKFKIQKMLAAGGQGGRDGRGGSQSAIYVF